MFNIKDNSKKFLSEIKSAYHENNILLYHWLIALKGYLKSFNSIDNTYIPDIDFVVTWVDGNDPAWKLEKRHYYNVLHPDVKANGEERYRNWDIFRYWFRSIELYAPWVRKIHVITYGHFPDWLNKNHPKLNLATHEQFIDKKYLPTFNSNSIELNIHKVNNLTENFVYFNDDIFLGKPVTQNDFFRNGLPCVTAVAMPVQMRRFNSEFEHTLLNVAGLINETFEPEVCIPKNPEKWFSHLYGAGKRINYSALKNNYFPGFLFSHLVVPLRKSTMKLVWENHYCDLDSSCLHKFRQYDDLMHQIFTAYEMVNGTFFPVPNTHFGIGFNRINLQLEKIKMSFQEKKYISICINDTELISLDEFKYTKKQLHDILERSFPQKSSFEL